MDNKRIRRAIPVFREERCVCVCVCVLERERKRERERERERERTFKNQYNPHSNVIPILCSYRQGMGRIWLTNVGCSSRDASIINCQHSTFGNVPGCFHFDDVAVECDNCKQIL